MYKIVVFIPETHLEQVKESMFCAGAGKIGQYDSCCFETKGKGQFRPLKGSKAFVGKVGEVEMVDEIRLEMVVEDEFIKNVISNMKKTHPYEMPAYDVIRLENF